MSPDWHQVTIHYTDEDAAVCIPWFDPTKPHEVTQ